MSNAYKLYEKIKERKTPEEKLKEQLKKWSQHAHERYITVSLPRSLVQEIDEIIKKGWGHYNSRAEFIVDSARRRLEELKKIYK